MNLKIEFRKKLIPRVWKYNESEFHDFAQITKNSCLGNRVFKIKLPQRVIAQII